MASFETRAQVPAGNPLVLSNREEFQNRLASSPIASPQHAEFLAYMSHELRTPLNAIVGFTQIMKMANELPGLQQNRDDYIDMVDQSAAQLLKVTQIMLSYLEQVCETEAARNQIG